ncbi:MAG: efflux RND transporter periplasmic adaptor subunit [Thermoguttaceae bacterium]
MKYFRSLIILTLIAAIGGGGAWYYGWLPLSLPAWASRGAGGPSTAGGNGADSAGDMHFLGWLAPADGMLDINGPPGDRLESLKVAEDAVVAKDQLLAILESRAMKQLDLDALQAQIQEATARRDAELKLAEMRAEAAKLGIEKVRLKEDEADVLEAKIKLLEANLALADKDSERLHRLQAEASTNPLSDAVVSDQEVERQELVTRQAKTELESARVELKGLRATQDLARRAAEAEFRSALASKDEALALIPLGSLAARREMAKLQLALTEIKAPAAGTVLKVFMQAGESIGPKPILRLANLTRMVARVEVYEVDAKQVRLGQPAIVRSAAFHAPKDRDGLHGRVVQIGRLVNTPELRSLDPFARVDRHVIPIRIELSPEDTAEAAHFVDLQVDVELCGDAK